MKGEIIMDVFQAIDSRRSIRKFKNEPVSNEFIRKILDAGIKAPSGKNKQPWNFVVVTGDKRLEIVRILRDGIKKIKAQGGNTGSAEYSANIMEQAPVIIFIFNPYGLPPWRKKTLDQKFADVVDIQSAGAAIQNMILAAQSLGLGTLWICDVFFAYWELCKYLNKKCQMIAALAIGYADENPPMRPRKSIDEVTEWL